MKVLKTADILAKLKKDGWVEIRQSGSHKQFKHPTKKGKVTINGSPSTDVTGNLLKSIESQSGLVF